MNPEASLQPLSIAHVTLANRVVSTAHITGFAAGGCVTPDLIAYHSARARGGVGLIVTETGSVHPSYRPQGIHYFAPGVGAGLRELADAVHAYGTKIFGQLNHGGAQSPPSYDARPLLSASYNDGQNGGSARAMSVDEIHEITEAYVAAAVVLADSGYDGCEVHGAHSYLINHFLSPLYNRRDDEYGGTFEKRLTFVREILTGIRAAVDRPFVVGVRLGAEIGPGGLGSPELADIGLRLEQLGLVDYVTFSLGGRTPESMPLMTGTMERPAGYELAWNELPSRAITVPTIVTGRFRTLAEASAVIDAGIADAVGMTRAHIADPQIVAKTAAGTVGQVRMCIGCNECQAALLTAGKIRCAVNAALPGGAGTDDSRAEVESEAGRGRLLVVGGGPAGMEAARVAALRGYSVLLAEKSDHLGGAAKRASTLMPNAPGMAELAEWLEREIRRLGVEIVLNQTVDVDFVNASGADTVLVATGSAPRVDGIQSARPGQVPFGLDRPGVLSSLAALDLDASTVGSTAVVVDDIGDYEAIGVAEHLVDLGVDVTVVTPFFSLASPLDATYRPLSALGRLARTGRFRVLPTSLLAGLGPNSADITYLPTSITQTIAAETVVLVTRNRPVRNLVPELEAAGVAVYAIGDARAPRNLLAAVSEGYRWEAIAGAK